VARVAPHRAGRTSVLVLPHGTTSSNVNPAWWAEKADVAGAAGALGLEPTGLCSLGHQQFFLMDYVEGAGAARRHAIHVRQTTGLPTRAPPERPGAELQDSTVEVIAKLHSISRTRGRRSDSLADSSESNALRRKPQLVAVLVPVSRFPTSADQRYSSGRWTGWRRSGPAEVAAARSPSWCGATFPRRQRPPTTGSAGPAAVLDWENGHAGARGRWMQRGSIFRGTWCFRSSLDLPTLPGDCPTSCGRRTCVPPTPNARESSWATLHWFYVYSGVILGVRPS